MTYLQIAGAIVATIANIGAIFLAYHGKDGWRWLIVLAMLAVLPMKVGDDPTIDIDIKKTVDSQQTIN